MASTKTKLFLNTLKLCAAYVHLLSNGIIFLSYNFQNKIFLANLQSY